jgi:peroxiredoxin
MNMSQRVLFLSIAILAGLGGSLAYHYFSKPKAPSVEATLQKLRQEAPDLVGTLRPDYRLGSSTGEWVEAADFDGSPVLVNFWATWCAPCRKEMPMLSDIHTEFSTAGLQVVGIALDDVEQARGFADELGINYPILVGSTDVMTAASQYGNSSGVLPYSVLLDSDGIIRWVYLGELHEDELRLALQIVMPEKAAKG